MDLHLGRHVGGASSTCRFVSGALSPRVCKAVDSSITSMVTMVLMKRSDLPLVQG